jgi:glutamate carboxypeptidase
MQLTDLKQWIQEEAPAIDAALRELVEINTYTNNTFGVDSGMAALSELTARFNLKMEEINERHRLIKAGNGKGKPRIMLISHMDTVFPPDGDFQHYEKLEGGFVRGPGTGDIKGGLLIGLWSMVALEKILDTDFDVQMVISADEENGSPTIRDWYTGGHIGADIAIALEPGFPQGPLTPTVNLGVVYQRRGYAAMQFTVKGKACHSGTAHLGVDAIESFARRVIDMKALNDPSKNISITVGLVNGGISPNTVAGEVRASVSWRFERLADGQRIQNQIEEILDRVYIVNQDMGLQDSCDYVLDAFIPPMEKTEENMKVIEVVLEEAKRLGQNVVAIARGGGSDANFTSAAGTPSICGMGAPTDNIHTDNETIYFPGLLDRIELLTSTLYRLVK